MSFFYICANTQINTTVFSLLTRWIQQGTPVDFVLHEDQVPVWDLGLWQAPNLFLPHGTKNIDPIRFIYKESDILHSERTLLVVLPTTLALYTHKTVYAVATERILDIPDNFAIYQKESNGTWLKLD